MSTNSAQEGIKMANENKKRKDFSRRDFIRGAAGEVAIAGEVTVLGNPQGSVGKGPSACEGSQDLALINGKFLTLHDKNSVVSAVTIRKGRIAELGRHA
jgi:hypothetical protein